MNKSKALKLRNSVNAQLLKRSLLESKNTLTSQGWTGDLEVDFPHPKHLNQILGLLQ